MAKKKEEKVKAKYPELKQNMELEGCTFRPKINPNNFAMKRRSTSAQGILEPNKEKSEVMD